MKSMFLFSMGTLFLTGHAYALEWVTSYESHATGSYVNLAERNAIQKGLSKMGPFKQMCAGHEGTLTNLAERRYCLLESPGFPAECVVTTFLKCNSDRHIAPADNPQLLEGLYFSEDDKMFFEPNADLTYKTSLNSSFRKGQSIDLPNKLKAIGNNKFFLNGTIEADGRCKTTITIEIEKLNDGSLVIKETSPHDLNWSFGCRWKEIYPTYYNLKPVKFVEGVNLSLR